MAFDVGQSYILLRYKAFVEYIDKSIACNTTIPPNWENNYLHDKYLY